MTAFATVWPSVKFTLDTASRTPHAYTVTNPDPAALATVTFIETAPTPFAGTKPLRSVSCTSSPSVPPTLALATVRSRFADWPTRVSNTRLGPTGVIAGIDGPLGGVVVGGVPPVGVVVV